MSVSPIEAIIGLLLVFVLPGLGTARALFPEWRFRGPEAAVRAVETVTLTLVLSVAYTILIGFGLLSTAGGFTASWSTPTLEIALAGVSAVAFGVAALRGAFARVPPAGPVPEPLGGEAQGAELLARAEELAREERRIRHELRVGRDDRRDASLRAELDRNRAEARRLGRLREEEYAQ